MDKLVSFCDGAYSGSASSFFQLQSYRSNEKSSSKETITSTSDPSGKINSILLCQECDGVRYAHRTGIRFRPAAMFDL